MAPARGAASRAKAAKLKPRAARLPRAQPKLDRARREPSGNESFVPGLPLDARFPIVGVGASAGGLEAFTQFLKNVPPKSGMAFVLIQHLDPTRKGMLVELLKGATTMPVTQATDGVHLAPDHVYVAPPGKDITLVHGRLHLLPQVAPRGHSLPIDFFFRSLAEDQQDRAIGVVLSGMGSDGSLGLRAIKERFGASFVQSVESAKYGAMPQSVIDDGLVDVVAKVEELPGRILSYCKYSRQSPLDHLDVDRKQGNAYEKICGLLRSHTGNDFFLYKRSTVYRRVERRMSLQQIESPDDYVRLLRGNPRENDLLFKELLIGVTSFFRDPATWEKLGGEVLPAMFDARPSGSTIRAWVAGCSTGEEAYSLAILMREALEPLRQSKTLNFQIFATDLDRDAVEKARQGFYPKNIAADVSPARLKRWFVKEETGYRIGKEIREMVVFAPQNLITDPPFTKLDVLTCRNVLIYFSGELQKRLLPVFHYSLLPSGILFLGSAETVGNQSSSFAPIDGGTRLYRKVDPEDGVSTRTLHVDLLRRPSREGLEEAEPIAEERHALSGTMQPPNLQTLADRALLQRIPGVGILCNDKGDVLYISGPSGKYLEPAVGKANLSLWAMAREGLRSELSGAFARAARGHAVVTVEGISMASHGRVHRVNATVQRLVEPTELEGTVLIVIADAVGAEVKASESAGRAVESRRNAALKEELQRAQEDIQSTRQEAQTSQEELRSTNEELQSMNEELTTSKEELQSLNEELQTLNQELQAKVDELSRSNNDLKNLLNSTDIATLFLDGELRVRRFTTQAAKIIKLIPSDVGRSITDIASDLQYGTLIDDVHEVLRTLVFKEKQAGTSDGRWFSVRIMPYRTNENVIDGVVITFTDSGAARALEQVLRTKATRMRRLAASRPALIWGCQPNGAWDYLGPQWVEYTGVPQDEQLGYRWLEQVHADDRERVREEWRLAVEHGNAFESELRIRSKDGVFRWFNARAEPIHDPSSKAVKWYGAATDVNDIKEAIASKRVGARGRRKL